MTGACKVIQDLTKKIRVSGGTRISCYQLRHTFYHFNLSTNRAAQLLFYHHQTLNC